MNTDHLNLDKFINLAPFAFIVIVILLIGVGIAGYFTSQHIKSLKEWLKDKIVF